MKKEQPKNQIIKPEELPENEKVYLKKSLGSWKVVYPWKNEDGTMNWFNFLTGGSWWRLIGVIFVIALILGMTFAYAHDTRNCRELISDPCKFFPNISRYCTQPDNFDSPFGDLGDMGVNLNGEEG